MSAPTAGLPWRVPGALAATQIVHWGSLFYAFSVLMPAIAAEMGWQRETVVGAFSAALLAEAAAAVLVGTLLDRIGARRVMAVGSLAAGLGLLAAGQVTNLWQLYMVWICLGVVMATTLYEASFAAVTAAFGAQAARRGIAVVVFAGGLASTVAWPLTGAMVTELGWRDACAILALANALCALPHLFLLPRKAQPDTRLVVLQPALVPAVEPGLTDAIRQPRFWGLAFVYAVVGVCTATIAVHLVPLLQERGLGAAATQVASLFGVAQVAGRIMEFLAGRRWSLRATGIVALAIVTPAFLCLASATADWVLAAAVLFYGAANGALTIVRGALPSRMFGTAHYGAIAGALAGCGALARSAGPIAVAALWQQGGGYTSAMLGLAALAVAALAVFVLVTRRA
ncbi:MULTISPECIES: MFS transporter [Roseomonadaceae]|uniref:MFS transporter n=1 Tax=Falsiroseomonas oleicola TaxID=2801474 RepID=A0ABS6HBK3_9PROT|nr:MFS transporter [Roseomonas oleicola]MBU8546107.1 MFS transporter [Roseomonas oleicola]